MSDVKFCTPAWVYVVMYHSVAIGTLDSNAVIGTTSLAKEDPSLIFAPNPSFDWGALFHESVDFDWDCVTELRIFNEKRELRIIRNMHNTLVMRDSQTLASYEYRNVDYLMYGTKGSVIDDKWTVLSEDRGGDIYFPAKVETTDGKVQLWLKVRNFLRFTQDLRLEVCDYAFTGFKPIEMEATAHVCK